MFKKNPKKTDDYCSSHLNVRFFLLACFTDGHFYFFSNYRILTDSHVWNTDKLQPVRVMLLEGFYCLSPLFFMTDHSKKCLTLRLVLERGKYGIEKKRSKEKWKEIKTKMRKKLGN